MAEAAESLEDLIPAQDRAAKPKRKMPRGRPFVKGVSANPGGNPKLLTAEFKNKCRAHALRLADAIVEDAEAGTVTVAQVMAFKEMRDSAGWKPRDEPDPLEDVRRMTTEALLAALLRQRPELAENMRKMGALEVAPAPEATNGE